jgi:polyadenylation factor subunit 2
MSYEPRGDHGRDRNDDGGDRPRARGRRPVTDYGATMAHWMRNRKPRYKGAFNGEAERPSASYIVDVSTPTLLGGLQLPPC